MKNLNKNVILYGLLIVIALVAIFFYLRTNKLQKQLHNYDKTVITLDAENFIQRLMAVDSLLMSENYDEARQVYENLLTEVKENKFTSIIQQRINQLQQVETRQKKQDRFKNKELQEALLQKTEQVDSLSRQLAVSGSSEVEKIDSLRFALAKANMRMESLSQQLTEKTKNDYLKFADDKGTEIYYVGGVKGKKANGWGVGLYSNGSRYEGEWESNLRHGSGVFFWPDGEYYSGEFVQDQRQGEGKYYWPNGEMFAGEWQDDKRNGEGVFYGKDGNVVAKGTWKNNELVKKE